MVSRSRGVRVAGLCAVLYAAAYLSVLSLDTGHRPAIVVDDLGNLISPSLAALACGFAARRCAGRLRLSWGLLAAYAGTWALGQLAWVWYEVVRDLPVPFPGLPDVGYVACVPFVVAALLVHPDAPRLASGALRLSADAVLVSASLLTLTWRAALGDAYRSAGGHGLAQVLGLGYPVLDVVVITLLVLLSVRARGRENRPFLWIAACLTCGAVGHVVYGVLAQNGGWQPGNPVDGAWGVGFLFLAIGAVSETAAPRRRLVAGAQSTRAALLPYAPLAVAVAYTFLDSLRGHHADNVTRGLGLVIFGSVLARQFLSIVENGRLNHDLEATVARRTKRLRDTTVALERQAWSDLLTGLPNRARFNEAVAAAIQGGPVAVALLDLDGFKSVNDSLGHAAGDELLAVMGGRLLAALPPNGMAARLGGDEFAFLLTDCATEHEAVGFGRLLLDVLAAPVNLSTRSVVLTGSLGIVLPEIGAGPDEVLRNADVAMHAAKEAGKDRLRLFEPAMRESLLARVAMEGDLRAALVRGEVQAWFQPVVALETGRTVGVEALARWSRDGQMVPPNVFIPLAEQCGLVPLLGRQVLRQSCAAVAELNRIAPLTVSVNLSAVQLDGEDLVDVVREALRDSGLDPRQLVLEITETVLMRDVEAVAPKLEALRALGIRVALDDFGTGYCALGYLQQIPVDIVKIDRAFVREVHLGPRQGALAAAVMSLATSLDLDVIAKGIELPEQAQRLRELGCTLAQGFLYSAAQSPEGIRESWRKQHGRIAEKLV